MGSFWDHFGVERGRAESWQERREFCLNIIKSKGTRIERGIGKRKDEGTESRAAANQINGEDTCFCIFFFPKRLLMFYKLIMCITKSSMF